MQSNESKESAEQPPQGWLAHTFLTPLRRGLDSIWHWAPLWAPTVLLLQILLLGLAPALKQRQQLAAQRPAVQARHDSSRRVYKEAQRINDAWQDPMFQARKERLWNQEQEARRREVEALRSGSGGNQSGADSQ